MSSAIADVDMCTSPEAAADVTSPAFCWGIKQSFRTYLEHIEDATTRCDGGATTDGETFRFPLVHDADARRARFAGTVRISAYEGLLDVVLDTPELLSDGGWALAIGSAERRIIARLSDANVETAGGEQDVCISFAAALTGAGAAWMGTQYRAGQVMDPVTALLPRALWIQIDQSQGEGAST